MVQVPHSSALHYLKLLRESSNGEAEDLRGLVRLHCTRNCVAQTTGGACEKIEYRALIAWRKLPPFNSLKDHAVTLQAIKLLKQRD